ncbi:MAG: methylated-DNA--[protein]-cysteine S-methyltransferase [Candidatus Omnitrophica bacterium]|nr:methylated-DNA--[protein]-cysteine S-methyltransferase [Candidatus Omnitrophota bacterium]
MKTLGKETEVIEKACEFITQSDTLPTLKEVAAYVHLSPAYFHRLFTRGLGITPRDFADATRQKRFRDALKSGDSIAQAIYSAGYGSTSRVYEFAYRHLGMTPRQYEKGGACQRVWFTIVKCPLGQLLVAATAKGICFVNIHESVQELQKTLKEEFPAAEIIEKNEKLKTWTQALIDYLSGEKPWPLIPYDIQATAFQRKVWDWLRTVPPGTTYNYSEAAKAIGNPKATRAVARACATNPAALVIPCHRIVPKAGGVGGYRWHPKRKEKLLKIEKAAI